MGDDVDLRRTSRRQDRIHLESNRLRSRGVRLVAIVRPVRQLGVLPAVLLEARDHSRPRRATRIPSVNEEYRIVWCLDGFSASGHPGPASAEWIGDGIAT